MLKLISGKKKDDTVLSAAAALLVRAAAQRDVPRGGPRLAPQLHLLLPGSVLLCLRGSAQVVRPSLLGEV